jgi:hypothetical protein
MAARHQAHLGPVNIVKIGEKDQVSVTLLTIRMAARHKTHLGPVNIVKVEKMIR